MDDESRQLLREIRDLQIKQMELLKAALLPAWMRWRFSLSALLIFTTVVAIFLGSLVVFSARSRPGRPPMTAPPPATPFVR
jgi:hypothetical protein